jgi:hypothetical protein
MQELASNSLCHFVGFFKKEKGFNPHHHPNHGVWLGRINGHRIWVWGGGWTRDFDSMANTAAYMCMHQQASNSGMYVRVKSVSRTHTAATWSICVRDGLHLSPYSSGRTCVWVRDFEWLNVDLLLINVKIFVTRFEIKPLSALRALITCRIISRGRSI